MSAKVDTKVSYFNTLIFTVITGIISLGIMCLLFFDIGKRFLYFIIAFEIGIFAIIGFCLYVIISTERAKKNNKIKYVVRFDECPDYYTKKIKDGKEFCINKYAVKDTKGNVFIAVITPAEIGNETVDVPKVISSQETTTDPLYTNFELRALESDANIPNLEDKCKLMYNLPPNEDKYMPHVHYSFIPWTYAKSRCESVSNF